MCIIYALIDPRYATVRYVGLSNDGDKRFLQHLSLREKNVAKKTWMKDVKASHNMVIMEVLDKAISKAEAKIKEAYWIAFYRSRFGANLTNILYPKSVIAPLSAHNHGFVEFDVPTSQAESLLHGIYTNVNLSCTAINGAEVFPQIDQVAIYVDMTSDVYWVNFVTKWARRAYLDRQAACYRYRIKGYSWAVFGDIRYLERRQSAEVAEDYIPWIELMNIEASRLALC